MELLVVGFLYVGVILRWRCVVMRVCVMGCGFFWGGRGVFDEEELFIFNFKRCLGVF